MEGVQILAVIGIAVLVFIFAATGLKIIRPWERGLVERLGKYQRTAGSGLTLIVPFLERLIKVDMREQVVDVPPQQVITKDNVAVEVDAVVYYEVTDPIKVTYNVVDYYTAATKLAQTNLRNLIGDLSLDESLTSREVVNTRLRQILDDATDKWGTKITRVELQRIEPPNDVTDAMHRQMKAERDRRAMILEAEGHKRSAILQAEGARQAAIVNAEGEAEAIKKVADAHKYEKIAVADGKEGPPRPFTARSTRVTRRTILLPLNTLRRLARSPTGRRPRFFCRLRRAASWAALPESASS